MSDNGSNGGDATLLDEITTRWSRFFQPDVEGAGALERASFVAVEPDEAGTWCVRIHAAGEQADLVAGGLNRAQATETMMGLMELLSRRYSGRPGRPWRN